MLKIKKLYLYMHRNDLKKIVTGYLLSDKNFNGSEVYSSAMKGEYEYDYLKVKFSKCKTRYLYTIIQAVFYGFYYTIIFQEDFKNSEEKLLGIYALNNDETECYDIRCGLQSYGKKKFIGYIYQTDITSRLMYIKTPAGYKIILKNYKEAPNPPKQLSGFVTINGKINIMKKISYVNNKFYSVETLHDFLTCDMSIESYLDNDKCIEFSIGNNILNSRTFKFTLASKKYTLFVEVNKPDRKYVVEVKDKFGEELDIETTFEFKDNNNYILRIADCSINDYFIESIFGQKILITKII